MKINLVGFFTKIIVVGAIWLATEMSSKAADANVTVLWEGGNGTFKTNINFYATTIGETKTLSVTPQSGYRFKGSIEVFPDGLTVDGSAGNYTVSIISQNKPGSAQIKGKIEPIPTGGGGGGGGPKDRDFDISVLQKMMRLRFTQPDNGTNLFTMVNTTNSLAVEVVLGDMTAPSYGKVHFNPGSLGSFVEADVDLQQGAANGTFVSGTSAGSGNITATASQLKEGNTDIPGTVSSNLTCTVFNVVPNRDLWWINSTTGDSSAGNFPTNATLTINGGSASASYTWFVYPGDDKIRFGSDTLKTTTGNQVGINSYARSGFKTNDVTISVKCNGRQIAGKYLTCVFGPYSLLHTGTGYRQATGWGVRDGYITDMSYQVKDNADRNITQNIEVNESFGQFYYRTPSTNWSIASRPQFPERPQMGCLSTILEWFHM